MVVYVLFKVIGLNFREYINLILNDSKNVNSLINVYIDTYLNISKLLIYIS